MKLKSFCTIKNDFYIEEAAQRIGENLCQQYITKGIGNQNTQGAQETKLPKKSVTQ
jgi:hypothetical protein